MVKIGSLNFISRKKIRLLLSIFRVNLPLPRNVLMTQSNLVLKNFLSTCRINNFLNKNNSKSTYCNISEFHSLVHTRENDKREPWGPVMKAFILNLRS